MRGAVGGEALAPGAVRSTPAHSRVEAGVDVLGHLERRVGPAERRARGGDFLLAQRRAVRLRAAGLARRALADHRAAADQRRLVGDLLRLGDRAVDRGHVVAVDAADHVPAVGLEARGRVVGEPAGHLAVDRDAVVVVEHGELGQPPGAGERAGLVRDALHQAAVADERPGAVVDDRVAGPVELRGQELLGERHAHRVGQPLAERAGGGLDPGRGPHLRVAGGLRVQLAEALQLLDRQVVARQVQERVLQHRAVAVGQHETVAVGPARRRRIVLEVARPQRHRDLRHPHRHPRMAALRRLHRVHRERSQRIGHRLHVASPLGRLVLHGHPARRLRSISCRIIGVRISCIARLILPPGTTMMFGRDM